MLMHSRETFSAKPESNGAAFYSLHRFADWLTFVLCGLASVFLILSFEHGQSSTMHKGGQKQLQAKM
jgi:hypothetical protein